MSSSAAGFQADPSFSADERAAVYRAIYSRRDVRSQFLPDPVADDVLARVLGAAHHAPSVGFMQPWDFIVVRSPSVRRAIHADFCAAHAEAGEMFAGEKRQHYRQLKLEGILEAPLNLCITCDRERNGPVVIGRTHMMSMDVYSVVCAVQNLWLAARAEGLGVGWVSILHEEVLRQTLGIPEHIMPLAYLCIGYVSDFHARPELEERGWLKRMNLPGLLHFDGWQQKGDASDQDLLAAVTEVCARAVAFQLPVVQQNATATKAEI